MRRIAKMSPSTKGGGDHPSKKGHQTKPGTGSSSTLDTLSATQSMSNVISKSPTPRGPGPSQETISSAIPTPASSVTTAEELYERFPSSLELPGNPLDRFQGSQCFLPDGLWKCTP